MDNHFECVKCGKHFESRQKKLLCSDCSGIDQNVFGVIRDYLYDFPGASVNQVIDATGVSSRQILKYLKEGRIETVGETMLLNCEVCNKPISFGAMCENCRKDLNHSFQSASKAKTTKTKQTMHTQQKKK